MTSDRSARELSQAQAGGRVVFRVEGARAILARTPDLLALAGSVPVPAAKRGAEWTDVLRQTGQSIGETGR